MNVKRFFKYLGSALTSILLCLSVLLLAFSMYTAYTLHENPNDAYLFGYKPILVLTDSMEPTLKTNGVVIVKQATYDEVKEDDILMYEIGDKLITHRIVEKTKDGIITKGDNNSNKDAYTLTEENVRAKVISIWNWTATPLGDIFPDGIDNGINMIGIIKWIGYPVFILVVLKVLMIVLKKIDKISEKEEKDENDKI